MKNILHKRRAFSFRAASFFLIASAFTACATMEVRQGPGPSIEEAQKEKYDGPKARIAIADFEDKMSSAGQYRGEYGRGMADMLATALFHTNRFVVLERQKLSYILAEQDLGASGRMRRETAARIGEIEGADILVVAAVTGFDPGVSGGGGSLGAIGGGILGGLLPGVGGAVGSALGTLAGGMRTSHVAIDVRLVDAKTARVLAATSAEAKATDFSGSLGVAGTDFGGALGGFAKTPMEKAIREVIQGAVEFVATKTPSQYYRVAAAQAAPASGPELQPGQPGPQAQASQLQTGFMPQGLSQAQASTEVANIPQPPLAQRPSLKTIVTDNNPNLTAELTETNKRGAVVSVTVIVRNLTQTKQKFEFGEKGTYLLNYDDGTKYPLISIQGRRKADLGPNEQSVIRANFKAPTKGQSVGVVIEDMGTFDDITLQ